MLTVDYRWAVLGFWGIILLFGIVHNLVGHLGHRGLSRMTTDAEVQAITPRASTAISRLPPWAKSVSKWCKTHLTLPSVFDDYHRRTLLGCTIPTRLEGLVLLSFWALNLILCCIDYRGFEGNV